MNAVGAVGWKYPFKPLKMTETSFAKMDVSGYTMEKKYDGWRAIVVSGTPTTMWTREKVHIEMPENVGEQLAGLNLPGGTILDGEIWNPLKRGSWRHDRKVRCKLTVWDIVQAAGRDVSGEPIEERRRILESLLDEGSEDVGRVMVEDASRKTFDRILGEVKEFREENAIRSGFVHGVVLKRRGSPRRDHATRCVEHCDWLKMIFDGMSGWAPRL